MKDYTRFAVKDFIMDEYFQAWIFNPTRDTESFWQTWLDDNPQKRHDVEEARTTLLRLNFSSYSLPAEDVSRVWNNIRGRDTVISRTHGTLSIRNFLWYGVTAAILIVGLTALLWVAPKSLTEYTTAFGETKTIILPDGSAVILNSNSSLKLNSDWTSSSPREVWLDGEAFFSVVHKKNNQSFKVRTGENIDIEVLGTTFNVYNRHQTKIVLNSGKIQLRLPTGVADEKIVMEPGELVEYDEKKYIKRSVDPKVYTAWTKNTLLLNRTSLREMLHMIKDNYGIDVEVKESLLDQTISGSMPVTDADNLLQQIAKAFQLKVVREGGKTFLRE